MTVPTIRPRRAAVIAGILGMLLVLALGMAPASMAATSGSTFVDVVVKVPLLVVQNACNGEPVGLHGQLHVRELITPAPDGGSVIRSLTLSEGLTGTGAVTGVTYQALDAEASVTHSAPGPGPYTFSDAHVDLLAPQGAAPAFVVVMVLRETVAADGTATVSLDRTYSFCPSAAA
jgi:hypothetical protein